MVPVTERESLEADIPAAAVAAAVAAADEEVGPVGRDPVGTEVGMEVVLVAVPDERTETCRPKHHEFHEQKRMTRVSQRRHAKLTQEN